MRSCHHPMTHRFVRDEVLMPSPGGQVSRMGAVPSRQPPEGLPHGPSWAEPRNVGCGVRRGLPTSVRAVGLRQVDGMAL